jgi:diguanylate cyclase (GGDEF)-like protein/PAS domain S-box-containing protein
MPYKQHENTLVPLFHTPTAFLIVGLLYLVMPVVTWIVLSSRRSSAVALWCCGDGLFGVAVILIGLRGHVPAWATFPLANLLIFIAIILRIQSLRLDLAMPWRTAWITVTTLSFVLGFEGIRLGLGDALLRLQYSNAVWIVMYSYLAALAWRIGYQEQSRSARWIVGIYLLMAASMLSALIWMSIGLAPPDPLNSNPSTIFLALAGTLAAVIGNIAYVGLAFERSQRQAAEIRDELRNNEERLRLMTDVAPVFLAEVDKELCYRFVNSRYSELFGLPREAFYGQHVRKIIGEQAFAKAQPYMLQALSGQSVYFEAELSEETPWGHKTMAARYAPIRDGSARVTGFVAAITDITERKKAEDALRQSEENFKALTDSFPLAVYMSVGVEEKAEYANSTFTRLFGYTLDDVPAAAQWWPLAYPEETYRRQVVEEWQRKVEQAIATHSEIEPMEVVVTCKDGSHKNILWGYKSLCAKNYSYGLDLTARKQAEEEVRQLAFHDPLTQLPNRRLLLDRLQQALAISNRSRLYGALLFIDLDNFKALNDTLGHDKGDLLLQEVAIRLTASVRECDTVARLGGDEFVAILTELDGDPEVATSHTQKVGGKIIGRLNQVYCLAGHEHCCSASIGITLFFGQDTPPGELLKQADIALYQAKSAGRNTLYFFDS